MIGGIVEVASQEPRYLARFRGFLTISDGTDEIGRVPLEDITALILAGRGVMVSHSLLTALADRGSVVITCGENWHPCALSLPLEAHWRSAGVLKDQIAASLPLKKRLWQRIVQAKIVHQRAILARVNPAHGAVVELGVLEKRVKSGDPENMEAQAARHYWPALMGPNFRRARSGDDANPYLNYGYTILRAATARAVCGTGLNPALGLHHGSAVNGFALVDDLMEPYRPLVDIIVRDLVNTDRSESLEPALSPDRKRSLAAVLQCDVLVERGVSPLVTGLARLAQSVAACLAAKTENLSIPTLTQPGNLV